MLIATHPCSLFDNLITTHIATTSGVEAIIDDVDDVHDKFPSGLTIGDGQSVVLNTLLEAKAPTQEKPIGYGMHKKMNLELRCWSTNPSKVFFQICLMFLF